MILIPKQSTLDMKKTLKKFKIHRAGDTTFILRNKAKLTVFLETLKTLL